WFARIEEACAGFIERAFANMFPSDVEPAQIARKLVATMEARTQSEGGAMTVPNAYAVYVHPSDYQRLQPHRAYLEEEWAALLLEVGQRVGVTFAAPPVVELREDDQAVLGAIEIEVLDTQLAQPDHPPQAQAFVLRVVKGMPADARFAIVRPARVGRSRESDIFLVDPSVSRMHAMLEPQDDHLIVRDAGSTNGTFVNGVRVQLRAVRAGDRVAFGKTEMMVEAESGT
ncbi:MAG TPA: FhaA domain-containing protein, partial [Candidatus Baltobacteraceae bacterium]|nr:FhaA domain-containing protein [Candidatus Baltobacteraceae bacterium]